MPRSDAGSSRPGPVAVGVLVVDDQESFRGAMRELIEATEGFALAGEAQSGEAALELVAELEPQLVIMDKRMPGMGGIAAARALTERHPGLPVVLVSLEAPDEHIAASCGTAAFVRKQDLSPRRLRELWDGL